MQNEQEYVMPMNASIVIAAYNNAGGLRKVLHAMQELEWNGKYEIIVVNDGSTDGTREMIQTEFAGNPKIKFIDFQKNQGVCKARNAGIRMAQYEIIINMDHDCVPEKQWLRQMMNEFDHEKVGVVSAYGGYGGTSTAFRKKALDKAGGYDEDYHYYREDTDVTFKIMELGYEFKLIKANFNPLERSIPLNGIKNKLKYLGKRLRYHMNDVLLYKKHPTKICREFLHIRYDFLVDPAWDFAMATNQWEPGRKIALSSPRGIVLLENKSVFHLTSIVLVGMLYVLTVKSARLAGSLKFGKLLI